MGRKKKEVKAKTKDKDKKRGKTRRKHGIMKWPQLTMRSNYACLALAGFLLCLWDFQRSILSLHDLHQQVDITPDQSPVLSIAGIANNQQKAVTEEQSKTVAAADALPIPVPENYKDRLHFHVVTRGRRKGDCGMCQSLFGLYDSLVALNISASQLNFDRNHLTTKESVVFVYPEIDYYSLEGPTGNRVHIRWVLAPRETYPTLDIHSWHEDDMVFNFASSAAQKGVSSKNILQAFTSPQIGDDTDISKEAFFAKNRSGVAWMLRNADKFHGMTLNLKYIHERPGMTSTKFSPKPGKPIKAADLRKYEYFVSYDPYSFYSYIAAMSGAISIVYPIDNVSKEEWALRTHVGEYLREVGGQIPGIAYGWTDEEIAYAKKTMPDLRDFLFKVKKWGETNTIERMARDAYRYGKGHRSGFESAMLVREAFPSYFKDVPKSKSKDMSHSSNAGNLRTMEKEAVTTNPHVSQNLLSKVKNWVAGSTLKQLARDAYQYAVGTPDNSSPVPENYKDQLHFHVMARGRRGGDCGGCQVLFALYDSLVALGISASDKSFNMQQLASENKTVVFVYPEVDQHSMDGPIGKRVHIRWILAPVGKHTDPHVSSWHEDDMVFNYGSFTAEKDVVTKNILQVMINPKPGDDTDISKEAFFATNRSGVAWMLRKAEKFHGKDLHLRYIHNRPGMTSTQIGNKHLTVTTSAEFRKYEYFVSYDPYTFYSYYAAMSGTISIVYPVANVTKEEWALGTVVGEYLREVGGQVPGIAYGWTDDEIAYAKRTMPYLRDFMVKVKEWGEKVTVARMVRDAYRFSRGDREGFEAALLVRDAFPTYFPENTKASISST